MELVLLDDVIHQANLKQDRSTWQQFGMAFNSVCVCVGGWGEYVHIRMQILTHKSIRLCSLLTSKSPVLTANVINI